MPGSFCINFIESSDQNSAELLARHGYQMIRGSYIMKIDFDRTAPTACPTRWAHHPQLFPEKMKSGQRCTPGTMPLRITGDTSTNRLRNYYERRMMFIEDDPHARSFLVVYCSGRRGNRGDLAVLARRRMKTRIWVGSKPWACCRPWRKRGVGLALLQHSFCEHYRRGVKAPGWAWTLSSLTGAIRLYERAGMHVLRQINTV